MSRDNLFYGFEFYQDLIIYDQIGPKSLIKSDSPILDGNWNLTIDLET